MPSLHDKLDNAISSEAADDPVPERQRVESTSGHESGSSIEDAECDLVALRVLLADDRPGSNSGAHPINHYIWLWQVL